MIRTRVLWVLLLLVVLSLALTWPLLPHILTHAPGDGIDDPALAWNLWWAKVSWIDRAGQGGLFHNPFDADVMFYPVSVNLAFYTLSLLNGALSIPLQLAFSVLLASNLLLLSSLVLSGIGAYLLALSFLSDLCDLSDSSDPTDPVQKDKTQHHPTPHHSPALLAGLLYAFASAKLFYVSLGQFNIASSQWLPFVALYLLRSFRPPWRWRNGFMLGLYLCFQTWAELTYGSFGVLLIALVVAGALIHASVFRRSRQGASLAPLQRSPDLRPPIFRLFAAAAIAGILFTAGLAPYLANMLPDLRAEGDFLVEGGGFSDIFSADLLGFLFPTQLHPVFGGLIRQLSGDSALRPDGSQMQVDKGQHLFFGYSVLLVAAYGLWARRRQVRAWAVAGLTGLFVLVALGPVLRFHGYEIGIPGLFPLLLQIPFFQANRYPSRYSVLIVLGLALLLAVGAAALLGRVQPRRRPWLAVLLAGLLLFEHLSIPLPLSDFRLPPAYQTVAADTRPSAVLDLPIGWRNGFNVFGKADTIIMYTQWYQTFHGKPRLGGNTSRNPEHKFQYFMEHPVIGVLAALQDGRETPATEFALAQALAPDLLRFLNVHHVLVHQTAVPADFEIHLQQLLPLAQIETLEGVSRYQARWPAERQAVVLSAADAELKSYLRQGWGALSHTELAAQTTGRPVIWATRTEPQLVLPGFSTATELALTLYSPAEQTLRLSLAGNQIGRQTLQPGLNTLSLSLPPSPDGFPWRVSLRSDRSFGPASLHLAPRQIGDTGVHSLASIVVRSAGKETGDFGRLYVDGVNVSPNLRGYNLAALDPTSGAVLAAAAFDTHDPQLAGESERMAAWLQSLPPGAIVAGAVRDAAALNLNDAAYAALRELGVEHDVRGHLRRAHGFIGVKGAAAGTAIEAVSDLWPVTLVVGEGLTGAEPSFALVALGWTLQQ